MYIPKFLLMVQNRSIRRSLNYPVESGGKEYTPLLPVVCKTSGATDGHALLNSTVTPGQPYDTPLLSPNLRLSGVEAEKKSVRLPLGTREILYCLIPSDSSFRLEP